MHSVDYVVVGGGIVGLAVAAALSPFGSTALLERHPSLIQETSSRNSGVVHSGLYYPPHSLKTTLCMAGNANIWRLQERFPSVLRARRTGKWIGTCDPSEEPPMEKLVEAMRMRDIPHVLLSKKEQQAGEPLVRMNTVVCSTRTGIVDVASLRDVYVRVMERSDTSFLAPRATVTRIDLDGIEADDSPTSMAVTVEEISTAVPRPAAGDAEASNGRDGGGYRLRVGRALVCAAGLHMNELWGRMYAVHRGRLSRPPSCRQFFCRGRYVSYRGPPPVSRLVYPCPLPELVGLGVHSVVDMSGRVLFGPDATYVDDWEDHGGEEPGETSAFLEAQWRAVRRYIPSIARDRMAPDFAGVRPKLSAEGGAFRDFALDELVGLKECPTGGGEVEPVLVGLQGFSSETHTKRRGPRLVLLHGIESPGLTASSAIGEYVARALLPPEVFVRHLPPWHPDATVV